jgi:hypothetical protein
MMLIYKPKQYFSGPQPITLEQNIVSPELGFNSYSIKL